MWTVNTSSPIPEVNCNLSRYLSTPSHELQTVSTLCTIVIVTLICCLFSKIQTAERNKWRHISLVCLRSSRIQMVNFCYVSWRKWANPILYVYHICIYMFNISPKSTCIYSGSSYYQHQLYTIVYYPSFVAYTLLKKIGRHIAVYRCLSRLIAVLSSQSCRETAVKTTVANATRIQRFLRLPVVYE